MLRAILVFAAEELKEYATQVLKFRGEEVPQDRTDRLRRLGRVEPHYMSIGPLVVSHWRNRIIHPRSQARLTNTERDALIHDGAAIRESFKHLDIGLLLDHFEKNQPTLKDVTVLLAMSTRFVRLVDARLPELVSPAAVRAWLDAEELLTEVMRLENQARNGGSADPRGRARQFLLTMAPTLADAYYKHGTA